MNHPAISSRCEYGYLRACRTNCSEPSSDYPGHRQQSISELFGETVRYARKNFTTVLPVFLVAGVLNGLVFVLFANATALPNIPPNLSSLSQGQMLKILSQVSVATGYTWVEYFLDWLILYFAAGVAIWQMGRATLNPPMNSGINPSRPALNYAKLGATTFVSVLLVSLGLFVFLIGAIVIGVMLYLVLPVYRSRG